MDLSELLAFLEEITNTSTLDPVMYQYFHQLLQKRTVVFNRMIDESVIEAIYLPLRDFELDDSSEPVTLILNSVGGSVSDSFFLAHYLSHYKKKLNVLVTGCAASMAAIILAGGGKNDNVTRYCYPSSYGLIHDGYIAFSPSESKTAEDIIAFNGQVDKDIRAFIIENTNITPEQYDTHSRKQWFLNAKEMKDLNLVDKIIGVDD